MWQGTGIYAPLLPGLLSLNLSYCLFFTFLLHLSILFPSHLDSFAPNISNTLFGPMNLS